MRLAASGLFVLASVLTSVLTAACDVYDPDDINPRTKPPPAGMDAGKDGAMPMADAGDAGDGGHMMMTDGGCTPATEICNDKDDDCDGTKDNQPAANDYCEGVVLHAVTACQSGRCVRFDCDDGFKNCDGDPANGCEPECSVCGICDDAGDGDSGADDAGR